MPALDIKAIFQKALDLEPSQRPAFLDQQCAGHPEAKVRVEALLEALNHAGSFLERPAIDAATVQDGSCLPDAGLPTEGTIDYTPDPAMPAATSRPAAEGPGTRIGPYTLREKIGEGGMGVVYLADQDRPVKRRVALKIIKPGMDSEQVVARFEAERQALAIMDHPSIAKVLDAGATDSGRPYFVMELVRGVPITDYCDTVHLTPRERLELFIPVCAAVQHAHQKGIIHRDIKPSNVLVAMQDGKPVPRVIDFGIAKATQQKLTERSLFTQHGAIIGTLEYMSPEQAEMSAMDVDTRTDVYALGVMLYELLTGSTPLEKARLRRAGYAEILRRIKDEEPPKPSTRLSESGDALSSVAAQRRTEPVRLTKMLRGDLDWIVMKALEKDRTRRYETATGFARDIRRHLDGDPVEASPPSRSYRLKKFARKHRVALATAGAFALLLVAATGISVGLALWANHERSRAVKAEVAAKDQQTRAEDRERTAIDAVKRFGEVVSQNPELKNNPALRSLRQDLLKEPLAFFKTLRDQLQANRDTRLISLARLSDACFNLGYLTSEIGDKQVALIAYRDALAIWKIVVEANPTIDGFQSGLAAMHHNIGNLLSATGKPDEALKAHETALAIRQTLAKANPTVTDFQKDLAISHDNIGKLLSETGKLDEALKAHETALAIRQTLAKANPTVADFQNDLAISRNNIGVLLHTTNKLDEALKAHETALAIRQTLAKANPTVVGFQRELAYSYNNIANLLSATGKPDEALKAHEAAIAIRQTLAKTNPTVTDLQKDLAISLFNLGLLQRVTGKPDEALKAYKAAIAIQETLVEGNPTVTEFQTLLAASNKAAAELLTASGKADEALKVYEAMIAIQRTQATDHPESPDLASVLGGDLNNAACLHMSEKRWDEARARLEEAVRWQGAALAINPTHPRYRQFMANHLTNLTKTLRALGDFQGLAEVERQRAKLRDSDPAMIALDSALAEVIKGQREPADEPERLKLGQRAYDKALHAMAAKLWGEAIEANPTLGENRRTLHRYNAACAAALAGCVKSRDNPAPDDAARAKSREKALGWLNEELTAWQRLAMTAGSGNKPLVAQTLAQWKVDPDLAGIRDEAEVAKLPESERAGFAKLWADVEALLAKVQP